MNAPRAERTDVNGVLLLDKPLGLTSQQAVARVKRLFSARKAGHTGTLDPMADGLLPIGLGEATKYSQFLLEADKGYLASLRLGATTTTGDAEGEILEQRPVKVTETEVRGVLQRFVGAHTKTQPMHSASYSTDPGERWGLYAGSGGVLRYPGNPVDGGTYGSTVAHRCLCIQSGPD